MTPTTFLDHVLTIWLSMLLTIIAFQVVTGRISMVGLFLDASGHFSAGRLQLLVTTLGVLGTVGLKVLDDHSMNEVPGSLLAVMAASHSIYLLGKKTGKSSSA